MTEAEAMEQRAMTAAVRWARWHLGPMGFRDLITGVEVETLRYGRLITRYATRTGTWAEEPATGAMSGLSHPVALESLDLWSGSPEELAARTSHVAACRRCSGGGQVTCPSCHGGLRVSCSGCGGDGRRMSRARKSYRTVRCSDCRGTGKKKCLRCSKGQVGCSPCRSTGRMRRWLKVTTAQGTRVGVWPDDPRLRAHPGLMRGSPRALQWRGARTLETREHDGPLPSSRPGPEAEAAGFLSARSSLEPTLEPLRGRVLSQTLEVFEAPSATVHYTFAGKQGFLKLLGHDLRATPARDTRPFSHRFAALLGVFFLGFFFGAPLLSNAFTGRHLFYQRHPSAGLVAWAALGLISGCWLMMASWQRQRRADGSKSARRWHDRWGFGLTGLCALLYLGCFIWVRPSTAELSRLTTAGTLDLAELHANALQTEGDTSPAFIAARNAFVQARVQGMENRAAVKLVTFYARTKVETQPLETERQRLREAWILSALARNDESEVEQELTHLANEEAPLPLVNRLRARLEDQRLEQGKSLLAKGEVEDALRTLLRIQAPALAAEPPGPLVSHAYLLRARSCTAQDPPCTAQALKLAVEADANEAARTALATFRDTEAARLEQVARASGSLGPRLRALHAAEVEAQGLLSVLTGDTALTEARGHLLQRREELLRGQLPLGAPVEVAQALLGASGLQEKQPGVFAVKEAPTGTLVHLFVAQGMTRGLHVTATDHGREALATEALQQVVQRLTGHVFTAKDLVRAGTGVAHVPARLGPHAAVLGWQDGALVEALVGRVEP